jgi:hypothetical protein
MTSSCTTTSIYIAARIRVNISHKQTTAYHPESNGAVERLHCHLEDVLRAPAAAASWSKELPFVLLGLRAQPREDTGLSPAEAVFGAQIVLPNEFVQNDEFSVDAIVKIFPKPCMFLLLLCLGTFLAPICPASCQPSYSPLPSSVFVEVAWFHPFSCSTMAPTQSCAAAPTPSPSESGRGTRWSLSAASRLARPRTPLLAACVTAADCQVRTQAALPQPSRSCFQTRWFLHLFFRRRHETVQEPFSYPARRFLHVWDRRRHHRCHRRGTCPVNGHCQGGWTSDLFFSQPRPELGRSPVDTCLHPY